MLNAQQLVFELLKPHAAAIKADLKPDLKAVNLVKLPLVTFRIRLGTALNDGGMESPMAWSAALDLSWFGQSEDEVFDQAAAGYDFVHAWNNPFRGPSGVVPGLGSIGSLTDRSAPSLIGVSDLPGHVTVQYSAGFDIDVHEAPRPDRTD